MRRIASIHLITLSTFLPPFPPPLIPITVLEHAKVNKCWGIVKERYPPLFGIFEASADGEERVGFQVCLSVGLSHLFLADFFRGRKRAAQDIDTTLSPHAALEKRRRFRRNCPRTHRRSWRNISP